MFLSPIFSKIFAYLCNKTRIPAVIVIECAHNSKLNQ